MDEFAGGGGVVDGGPVGKLGSHSIRKFVSFAGAGSWRNGFQMFMMTWNCPFLTRRLLTSCCVLAVHATIYSLMSCWQRLLVVVIRLETPV